jgi:hypothetical protein
LARNSKSRLGKDLEPAKPSAADPVAELTETGSLSFATPTEFVELPSEGRHYPEEHPLHNVATVEIKYMTAKEEDILSSKTLIKQGVAIERLLKSIIVDKRIRPDSLLSGDRNAILVACRINGYGSDYSTKISCPSCMNSADQEFDLSILSNRESPEAEENDFEWTSPNTISVVAPLCKVRVEMKLMTGKEENYLARLVESKRKKKMPESTLTDTLNILIASVNGEESRAIIKEFIGIIPARDSRFLRGIYEQAAPNLDMTQTFECEVCSYVTDLEVPFTTDFFWPK